MSNSKKHVEKAKFEEVHGVRKHPKFKVNHQIDDEILLDSASQLNIFKQKDYVEFFISKGKHCIQPSGDGELCSKLRCKIAGMKGDYMFNENSTKNHFVFSRCHGQLHGKNRNKRRRCVLHSHSKMYYPLRTD